MRLFFNAILALVACGEVVLAATPHVDDFSTDAMGWGGGGVSVQWHASGGPMGDQDGYISVTSFNNLATLNTRSAWTGDYSAIDAATISVDLKLDSEFDPLSMRVVLFGPGATPQTADRWTSTIPAMVPADGVWRNYSFSLAETDLTHVLGSNNYPSMIANVVQVMLRHDTAPPSSGGDSVSATLGIDNVRLAVAPLPGDYNRNGEVDLSDYHMWRGMFGAVGSAADGNMNGRVDAGDYVFWRDRVTSSTVEVAVVAVPEGNSLSLVGAASLIGALLVKRRFLVTEKVAID